MIPIKFLIIFRELSITRCLRSRRRRQHCDDCEAASLHSNHTFFLSCLRSAKQLGTSREEIVCSEEKGRPGRKLSVFEMWGWQREEPRWVKAKGESSARVSPTRTPLALPG